VERRVLDVTQVWLEAAVELDCVHVRDACREVAREHTLPRSDLEDDVTGLQVGEPPDHAEDVLVDEEVLAELLLGEDPHSAKAALALASICRPSSVASSPRASA